MDLPIVDLYRRTSRRVGRFERSVGSGVVNGRIAISFIQYAIRVALMLPLTGSDSLRCDAQ